MTEILKATISYNAFKKIASGQVVEMAVGKSTFELRQKNLEGLRDLTNQFATRGRTLSVARWLKGPDTR